MPPQRRVSCSSLNKTNERGVEMAGMKKHINIPIFIPHLGCPNDCVFCNQRSISGKMSFSPDSVIQEIEEALSTVKEGQDVEIAFFGGSFTGIDRELMIYLLDIAQEYVDSGRVSGIRLSTRPDYINEEILHILKGYAVKTIELGIQSMDDDVLVACKRGHVSSQTEKACSLVKEFGFSLIGQMMVGLPLASVDGEKITAQKICEMGADGARIYPTVVFYDTQLCKMSMRGEYEPLDLDEAVFRTKETLKVFEGNNVPCIRVGLCASENLSSEESVYGGANHSAIGELAIGEIFFERLDSALEAKKKSENFEKIPTVYVPQGCVSKAIGQKRKNILRLCEKYSLANIKVLENSSIIGYNILLS